MKKITKVITLLAAMLIYSCDPLLYMDFYVENNCMQPIVVNAVFDESLQHEIDTIYPNSRKCIYKIKRILGLGFDKSAIQVAIEEMKITKDGYNILYNPLDTAKWDFVYAATKDTYEAVLTVNEEDFNDK
jgi:hypothetical protein